MSRMLTTSLVAVALSAGLGLAPVQAAPVAVAPVAETQTGSASGSVQMLLAWPLGFVLFGACFADGDSPTHNPLCQALLDLTAGSTDF
ncbi:hypothetical protein ACFVAV_12420 [Nocardia sp. NPDC057663]|uniref:hypothetical protein n=1 Tax=Nocardia sp. NPDC057663 TaxID=3346201 RepID=UPI00366E48FF